MNVPRRLAILATKRRVGRYRALRAAAAAARELSRVDQLVGRVRSPDQMTYGVAPAWQIASMRDLAARMTVANDELMALRRVAQACATEAEANANAWRIREEKLDAAIAERAAMQGDDL